MNNNYVKMYCEANNLVIKKSKVKGENLILDGKKVVGFFKDKSRFIEFKSGTYKKGDLLLVLMEESCVHLEKGCDE